jgi:hypothetical protein
MSNPLTPDLKQVIRNEVPSLEFWETKKDAHYAPGEGFICNECKECISFPII